MPRLIASCSLTLLLTAASAAAQHTPTFAEIEIGLEVYRVAELQVTPVDFGRILVGSEGGSLSMDAQGRVEVAGGIHASVDGPAGAPRPGTLTLDAAAGLTATIMLPSTVDLGEGVTFSPAIESTSATMTGGPVTLRVFGTLHVPPGARSGNYGGLLAVDVTYN